MLHGFETGNIFAVETGWRREFNFLKCPKKNNNKKTQSHWKKDSSDLGWCHLQFGPKCKLQRITSIISNYIIMVKKPKKEYLVLNFSALTTLFLLNFPFADA